MAATGESDHPTHRVGIWFQVCDCEPHEVAEVEISADEGHEQGLRELAKALHAIANVLDHNTTFNELVKDL